MSGRRYRAMTCVWIATCSADHRRWHLVPPSLLAVRGLRRSLAATLLFCSLAAFFLVFAVYEQEGLGRDALGPGLAILPLGIGLSLGPLCSPVSARWLAPRPAAFACSWKHPAW